MNFTIPLYPTTNPLSDTSNCKITYGNGFLYLRNSSNVILGERKCTPEEDAYLHPTFNTIPEEPELVKKYTKDEIYERVSQLILDAKSIGINLNITTSLEEN